MFKMPTIPDCPITLHGEAPLVLRYEDLAQDGRLMSAAMPNGLGTLWRTHSDALPIGDLRREGILPILSNIWIDASEEPMHLAKPAHCKGDAILGHTRNAQGQVTRLLLEMRVDIFATRGRLVGPTPAGEGEEVRMGTVYARHVFTRLFAPKGKRRVLEFSHKNLPCLPETEIAWTDAETFLQAPEKANALDEGLVETLSQVVFAQHHCDTNQHVNSLVYPRLFEDAAQTRFSDRKVPTQTLSRQIAIAYKKPFFSGKRATLALQGFQKDSVLAASGGFYAPGQGTALDRAHCLLQMLFR